jgi:M6 family metalloprotease-like protein
LNFPQEQGPEVRLRVFGDERYARYEDIDGYTMVYDKARGLFCYATLAGNRFASTGVPLDQPPPPPVVRHLRESLVVKRAKAEENRLLHHPPGSTDHHDVVRTFGPNQGLLNGRRLSIGKVRGLTILVNFRDVTSTTTARDVEEMLNGDNFTRNGNISSVREYFLRVSNGRLDYTNTVVGPFTLSQNREHYHDNLLVEEALQLAVDSGLNLKQFDSRNQGIVDAVNILYAGQSLHIDRSMLWPHNSTIDLRFGAMRTDLYLLTGLGRNAGELSIGTFCHENGHLLCRFPDMYDYGSIEREGDDRDSSGIGHYCLMGAGNHLDFGRSPSPVCAYLRDLAGWCDTVVDINTPDTYEAVHADYGTVMKYQASKPNEYFIVENRTKTALDRAGPSNGLAVYHCDIFGSNELQQGTADHHYQCALLQADGRRDLEDNANQGDSSDLFGPVAGMAVSSTSRPHSREWDGRESGLVLSDISAPGERIRFRAGQSTPSQTARGEQTPNLTIPDNRSGGVSSTIDVAMSGIVRRLRMTLDISHPFVSDLLVELLSPTGRRAVLHSRQGGSSDDLSRSYDSERPGGELSSLVGQPMQGPWVLRVSDRARADVGTLRKWSIEVESASA